MLGSSDYPCRHAAEPKAALEALVHHDGPLLLDLDETAYLRNSTEDFLDTASPGLPALLLLRLLDAIRPWRWTGGDATRDLWRVRLVGTPRGHAYALDMDTMAQACQLVGSGVCEPAAA
jgi:hypothetical protein